MGKKYLLMIAFLSAFCGTAIAQKASSESRIAYFTTDNTINYRDSQGRLHLQFSIDGVQSQQALNQIKSLYDRYGIAESVTFTPGITPETYIVDEISIPGAKMKMHRKLFVLIGIQFVNIDGELYETESFRMKMLQKN